MDKQQKNIQRMVADKVIKDIHKIVEEDKIKEKQERNGAMLVGGLVLFFVLFVLGTLLLQ